MAPTTLGGHARLTARAANAIAAVRLFGENSSNATSATPTLRLIGFTDGEDAVSLNFTNADINSTAQAIGKISVRKFPDRSSHQGTYQHCHQPVPSALTYQILLPALRLQGSTAVEAGKMGEVLGISASTVMRHWQAHGLKPHVVRGFKVLRGPGRFTTPHGRCRYPA